MRHSVHRVNIKVEKVPEFSAESLCLRQGMVTSGRWCHMTLLRNFSQSYIFKHIGEFTKQFCPFHPTAVSKPIMMHVRYDLAREMIF